MLYVCLYTGPYTCLKYNDDDLNYLQIAFTLFRPKQWTMSVGCSMVVQLKSRSVNQKWRSTQAPVALSVYLQEESASTATSIISVIISISLYQQLHIKSLITTPHLLFFSPYFMSSLQINSLFTTIPLHFLYQVFRWTSYLLSSTPSYHSSTIISKISSASSSDATLINTNTTWEITAIKVFNANADTYRDIFFGQEIVLLTKKNFCLLGITQEHLKTAHNYTNVVYSYIYIFYLEWQSIPDIHLSPS